MDADAIAVVTSAVLMLTQLAKASGVPRSRAPGVVALIALLGVLVWIYAHGGPRRELAFEYFAAWIVCATSAAGVYDLARATPAAFGRSKDTRSNADSDAPRGA